MGRCEWRVRQLGRGANGADDERTGGEVGARKERRTGGLQDGMEGNGDGV